MSCMYWYKFGSLRFLYCPFVRVCILIVNVIVKWVGGGELFDEDFVLSGGR